MMGWLVSIFLVSSLAFPLTSSEQEELEDVIQRLDPLVDVMENACPSPAEIDALRRSLQSLRKLANRMERKSKAWKRHRSPKVPAEKHSDSPKP